MNVTGDDRDLKVTRRRRPTSTSTCRQESGCERAQDRTTSSLAEAGPGPTDLVVHDHRGPIAATGQYFGRITLDPHGGDRTTSTIPVAFNMRQGGVTLAQSCTPTTLAARTDVAHCSDRAELARRACARRA